MKNVLPSIWATALTPGRDHSPQVQGMYLREELFSLEQLTRHAPTLALRHQLVSQHSANPLLTELELNKQILKDFNHKSLQITPGKRITAAVEWILDNFYLIEEQIQIARRHLPKGYSQELPTLLKGSSAGLPRVYDLAFELISHVDAQIDEEPLRAFVSAYQTVTPLNLGELWAIPIMLRLGLIENLKRITQRLNQAHQDYNLANLWVDRLQEMAEKNPAQLVIVVAEMAKSDLPLSSAFVAEFSQRLSQNSPELHLARSWLEHYLLINNLSIEQLVQIENQNQAAEQVSVNHSISSLRLLSALNWKAFVEGLSKVEAILCTDPAGVYAKMDFATRDRYRHRVEFFARYSNHSEAEVAQHAIELASEGALELSRGRTAHVGFYLIDKGQQILAPLIEVDWPWTSRVEHTILHFPMRFYMGGIVVSILVLSTLFMQQVWRPNQPVWVGLYFLLIFMLCASQLGVALMNWLSMLLVKPHLLPRLDYSEGIEPACRTIVAVPTLITHNAGIDRLLESLEIHHLANQDRNLHFALLTDFCDADREVLSGDDALLTRMREGVESLNAKYSNGFENPGVFFLLHRPRQWNAQQNVWMGYERKRGKLTQFNALLRGDTQRFFSTQIGNLALLSEIKYVITLDADTQLPRNAARQLVGTMAHILNRPVFDPLRGVVSEGYSILQPRVGVSLPSAQRSWFSKIFAGEAGIDPYTQQVSDVYQDLFKEGSFIGKGIYDIDAFQQALQGRFPENRILSHDLLEACHARSGLVSDIELYEAYPSHYATDMDRRHRWIRGDWQITQWLLPRVPGSDARRVVNPLSALSRWKIGDNLRRSLVPIALVCLMAGGPFLLPDWSLHSLCLAIAIVTLPGLLGIMFKVLPKPADLGWKLHLHASMENGARHLLQSFFTLVFLPYDAFVSLDAIGRSLLRLLITHKRLLEWQASSDSEQSRCNDLKAFYVTMWFAPVLALLIGLGLFITQPEHLLSHGLLLGLWLCAPALAWRISLPFPSRLGPSLKPEQLLFLRRVARKTWFFFETFVNAKENWLPPDNFQQDPNAVIASRTSPTNIGLCLLANLAARDFGYLSLGGLIQRTENSFSTLQQLDRYRGHFYNWYDTRSLQALLPMYVSSVDSGNLAGHLLTLSSGLREQPHQALLTPQIFAGLEDTLAVLKSCIKEDAALETWEALQTLEECLKTDSQTPKLVLKGLRQFSDALTQIIAGSSFDFAQEDDGYDWLLTLQSNLQEQLAEICLLFPWLALSFLPEQAADGGDQTLSQRCSELEKIQTLTALAELETGFCVLVEGDLMDLELASYQGLCTLLNAAYAASRQAQQYIARLQSLAQQSDEMAAMDFSFLLDPTKNLFAVGFNISEHRVDSSCYDLLASEARLCSYVAIALGQVPQDQWFALGRLLIASPGKPLLLSWSGSMFEYLMPMLVMPSYENTLLDHTCKRAVQAQIAYGNSRGVPWGISESGYNQLDLHLNYQYRAFGVPGLGLKRGLAEDLVVSPYSSVLALLVAPVAACENLQLLASQNREGKYGFFEAIDYTPSRVPPGESSVALHSFMAHHQGMSLLALVNVLHDQVMPRRFMACPALRAAELLLHERLPRTAASVFPQDLIPETRLALSNDSNSLMRVFTNPTPQTPKVHLLSNGRYHVVITSAGGGYSRWNDLALTRWREDATRDCWGTFVYLRDLSSGDFWSNAYQPCLQKTDGYEAIFTQSRAEFRHHRAGLDVHTEISVSPEDDVEIRRLTISNRSSLKRTLELTTYTEVVLALPAAEAAHPAFNSLFMQTEFVPESSALLCTRRPSSPDETPPWMMHMLLIQGGQPGKLSYESNRTKFVGRGRSPENPVAMQSKLSASHLSNNVGAVLDPILALRCPVVLLPEEAITVDLVFGVSDSREAVLALIEKYQSPRMAERTFDLAWTHSQVTLHHLNTTEAEAQLYNDMAGSLIYANLNRRASVSLLNHNHMGQSGLWRYGLSGDLPIVLLRVHDSEHMGLVRQLIQAHSYWRMKGLKAELLILNADSSSYRQTVHEQITHLIASGISASMADQPGGIFVRSLALVPHEDRVLLYAAARLVLDDELGSLEDQLSKRKVQRPLPPPLKLRRSVLPEAPQTRSVRALTFDNGIGGFTSDGREYVITLKAGAVTPAPWINVLANEAFGTIVSESGGAYTWFENAHEFRLTPWSNDPVQDNSGEAVYIRDDETGYFWSPTPSPARGKTPYTIRHGFGYTVFEHSEAGIISELWVYVARDAAVKFTVLKLHNISGRSRRVSVMGYCEWVLGDLRPKQLLHIKTQIDIKTGALIARNDYNTEFPERLVFLDVNDPSAIFCGDRHEFIGRNGTLSQPAALKRTSLSGKLGAGLDPCGAVHLAFDLDSEETREITFRLGVGRNPDQVQELIQRFRKTGACHQALEDVWDYWNHTLTAISLETPDLAVNHLANGWLLYQTLSSRLWGRTGFYQSGGAYGYRDQLQDVIALVHTQPALIRAHLLLAAAHQFVEGDVQHWWHPPSGRGVRTHFSDDYLWLPYVLCRYLSSVAETSILDEQIHWLEGRVLPLEEESYYEQGNPSDSLGSLYEHAVQAIKYGLKFGVHGLPLIGGGDWNDGMNRVGSEGAGESVWLAFFLYDILKRFAPVAENYGDPDFATLCLSQAEQLQINIEAYGWDGKWYLRAYFDQGEVLGSQHNTECQIDALPQSWAVLSGAGEPKRTRLAMGSVKQHLVNPVAGIIRLFDPPFDHSPLNPGYIKGYIPGVRENGGQYTQAAIWTTMAFAQMEARETAWELIDLLNPIHHSDSAEKIALYKVEPYVMAADIYTVPPHLGRGGWTWYTGSAGWMYQLLIETLLGLNLEGDHLRLAPRLPRAWPQCIIHYRYRKSVYHITMSQLATDSLEAEGLSLDGKNLEGTLLPLFDDDKEHQVTMKVRYLLNRY